MTAHDNNFASTQGSSQDVLNDDRAERAANTSRIVNDPSYLAADHDLGLLDDDAARGLRLQLEYLKPDWQLTKHGIDHTIAVFGSARLDEPAKMEKRLLAARSASDKNPDDSQLRRQAEIAERAQRNSRYYEIAREFGRLVGRAPNSDKNTRLFVVSGGGPGIMEAVHRGAYDVDAKSVGLNIELPVEQLPNPYVTPGLCFNFRYFALRKLHFLQRARALVAFPGGFGTLDELFETLTLVNTKKIAPLPIILVGEAYWKKAINFDFLVSEGTLTEEERNSFWYCETAEEIWRSIVNWYEGQGRGLFTTSAE